VPGRGVGVFDSRYLSIVERYASASCQGRVQGLPGPQAESHAPADGVIDPAAPTGMTARRRRSAQPGTLRRIPWGWVRVQ
jgi:hypothetical protein